MSAGSPLDVPAEFRFTRQHEWLRVAGASVTVGITAYAADALGDVVFLDLPEPGAALAAGEPCGEIESTKSVSELYSPVSGEVVAVNDDAVAEPSLVNDDPYGRGWLLRVACEAPPSDLLSAADYQTFCEGAS